MKSIKLLIALLLLSGTLSAQEVKFENDLSWAQVKEKAIREKKNIFLDFMATWCGPCRLMDQQVYNLPEVAAAVNSSFISVKIQSDKTTKDSEAIKAWYNDATELFKKYEVTALPTLLFVTPDGTILHRGTGFMEPTAFLNLVAEAKDPSQKYVLLNSLQDLLKKAAQLKAPELERNLARNFINTYLMKKSEGELYTKANLDFLSKYVSSNDKAAFKIFYPDASQAAAVLENNNIQRTVVNRVIVQDIIDPALYLDAAHTKARSLQPNWTIIAQTIEKVYGTKYAKNNLFNAKVGWYIYSPWKNYELAGKVFVDFYGVDGKELRDPNPISQGIFFAYVKDKKLLKIAAGWMRNAIKENAKPEAINTYANLLYKMGEKDEAIKWQKKAIETEEYTAIRINKQPRTEFAETLAKMEKGVPTWQTE